jgi:small subunit ribosomal protein S17
MTAVSVSPGEPGRTVRRRVEGVVESDVRDKTIRVRIDRLVKWPKYGKYVRRRTVVHAHDERNEARTGDRVQLMECRPVSRTKTWRLVRILASVHRPSAGETVA